MLPQRLNLYCLIAVISWTQPCRAENRVDAAIASVTAAELYEHVVTLADDMFEGRSVGSRGGRAAGQYIVGKLQRSTLTPAGVDGDYYQPCERGGRNVLAVWPGSDPLLRDEYIVVGAHYDHVGDGRQGHALGAIGRIYNGADDNASGVAELLEFIEALSDHTVPTRRSILFAFWDGEEQGLLGSKDWVAGPTVPLRSVRLAINIDMVGRLRGGRLEVLGTRTGYGLRRLVSGAVADPLWLNFSWELAANSDHWPFVERQVPIVMIHTGLHDDYHRPSDDVDKINQQGMQQVGRYLLATIIAAADADELPAYRPAGRGEALVAQRSWGRQPSRGMQTTRLIVQREPGRAPSSEPNRAFLGEPGRPRPRLGITWRTDDAEPASVYLTQVVAGSPAAAAGLAVEMRVYAVNGQPFADGDEFREVVLGLLDAGVAELTMTVESRGRVRTITIHWQPPTLAAKPAA
jgi:hypothetical protein